MDIARVRDPASPPFNDLKRELGQLVMEEQQRHHQDERRMAMVDQAAVAGRAGPATRVS